MKKIKTQLIGAGVLLSVLFFLTGCPNESKPSTPPKQYTVKFEAGAGGTLTAKTGGGNSITSGEQIYEGTKIIFTANPDSGKKVDKWEGLTAAAGTKTVTLTVTGNADVKVSFKEAQKYTITFSADPSAGGTVTAKRKDNGDPIHSGSQVYEGTEIMFTATPSTAGDGYYILRWTGKGLKVSPDKQTAELTVKNNTEIKVKFLEHLVENVNWDAEGQLEDINGNKKDFRLVINDGGKYFSFFDKVAGTSVFANMDYDENSKTVQLLNPFGKGSITFISMPQTLPAEWEISLSGVEIKGTGTSHILKLKDGTVKVNVTFSDNTIR
ncbi:MULTISPECIES: hypothetical protein [unclassified Treponema]|uniref:InlB B-repeat-containing protein n=1 Tax=unclassified Treponema TaxID=2638727 RepID=UPI0020A291B0|nr:MULTISPECIES: hypothetical protein [unclassified Treponema]UTC66724.1 hypothetical protein E4O06_12310 [Treponema sp. OMZ 789]UTC69456.1 hypothetical protein E4O01_12450 [Treponema sp. OMZ 790]UTC72170.1 hypothetical protein E4O02_12545 [Treponema sp. OMZ 791]